MVVGLAFPQILRIISGCDGQRMNVKCGSCCTVLAELVWVIQVFKLSVFNSENGWLALTSRLNHIKWIIAKFPLYMLLVLRLMSHPSLFQGDNITAVSHSSPVGSHVPGTYVVAEN